MRVSGGSRGYICLACGEQRLFLHRTALLTSLVYKQKPLKAFYYRYRSSTTDNIFFFSPIPPSSPTFLLSVQSTDSPVSGSARVC